MSCTFSFTENSFSLYFIFMSYSPVLLKSICAVSVINVALSLYFSSSKNCSICNCCVSPNSIITSFFILGFRIKYTITAVITNKISIVIISIC